MRQRSDPTLEQTIKQTVIKAFWRKRVCFFSYKNLGGGGSNPCSHGSYGPALCYSSSWLITLTLEECRKSCFARIMLMNYYCWVLIQCKYTLGIPFWVIKHNAFCPKNGNDYIRTDPIFGEWITFLAINSRTFFYQNYQCHEIYKKCCHC